MCSDSKGPKTIIMVKYFTKQIIEIISLKSIQLRNLQIWCLWAREHLATVLWPWDLFHLESVDMRHFGRLRPSQVVVLNHKLR